MFRTNFSRFRHGVIIYFYIEVLGLGGLQIPRSQLSVSGVYLSNSCNDSILGKNVNIFL